VRTFNSRKELLMRVGFIGLGSQGGPMARRIIEAGIPTTLWARNVDSLEPFADAGVDIATSPAELAAVSDVVCLCVVDDAGVEQVLTSEAGVLAGIRSGATIVVHSTVHPDTCRRLAQLAADRDASLIDAPVSGGGQAAAEGHLVVMVGSDPETFDRMRPVFATYGSPVLHLGTLGAGQTAKALNNLLFTAHLGTATVLFDLARSLGVDPVALAESVTHGSGRSYGFDLIAGMGFGPEPFAERAGALLTKDVGIVASLAAGAAASADILFNAAHVVLERMGTAGSP
jgi:3-hydroxyisobutyrate dehydrogenase